MVPPETFRFADTARHTILLGMPDDGRLEDAARISRLDVALAELPDGWETMFGERGVRLSGGQRRRTAIARALVRHPDVLMLNEVERRVLAGLAPTLARRRGRIVCHRATAVRAAREIIVREAGRIVELGTPTALTACRGRYATSLRRPRLEEALA